MTHELKATRRTGWERLGMNVIKHCYVDDKHNGDNFGVPLHDNVYAHLKVYDMW